MSPQLLLGEQYSPKSDLWALGIILYEMVFKITPWPSATKAELASKTLSAPLKVPRGPSPGIVELIVGCLKVREEERISFDEFFGLVWLESQRQANTLASHSHSPPSRPCPPKLSSISSISAIQILSPHYPLRMVANPRNSH
jgi:serine/threonine protein kinase